MQHGTPVWKKVKRKVKAKRSYLGYPEYEYPYIDLRKDGRTITKSVSHLVLEAFEGPKPERGFAGHYNTDTLDNRINNLFWDIRDTAEERADEEIEGIQRRREETGFPNQRRKRGGEEEKEKKERAKRRREERRKEEEEEESYRRREDVGPPPPPPTPEPELALAWDEFLDEQ